MLARTAPDCKFNFNYTREAEAAEPPEAHVPPLAGQGQGRRHDAQGAVHRRHRQLVVPGTTEDRRARLGGLFCFTSRMDPQRRTALVSVVAAIALIALKLGAGLASHSLGLISEALHSGTDLVAALLTFFAVGVAVRPADVGAPVRTRQGRASVGARGGGDPGRGELLHRLARDHPPRRREHYVGRGDVVRVRRDRRRDRGRHQPHGRALARVTPLPQRGARGERAALRQRPRRLRSQCSLGLVLVQRRATRARTPRPRCSSPCSSCSPQRG